MFAKMYHLNVKFKYRFGRNAFIIIQSKRKRQEKEKCGMTSFSFFNDPFHNLGFFSLPSSVTNFSSTVGIYVNITPSSPLSCNFQVFVVKMTHLLLSHSTSACYCGHRAKQSSAANRLFWLLYLSQRNDPAF